MDSLRPLNVIDWGNRGQCKETWKPPPLPGVMLTLELSWGETSTCLDGAPHPPKPRRKRASHFPLVRNVEEKEQHLLSSWEWNESSLER